MLFILFSDFNQPLSIWNTYRGQRSDFINRLEKYGQIYYHPLDFNKYGDINMDSIHYDTQSDILYNNLKGHDKWIVIGLNYGCPYAHNFATKYSDNCIHLILLGAKWITRQDFDKKVTVDKQIIERTYGLNTLEYYGENMTADKLKELKYISDNRSNHLIQLFVTYQYYKQWDMQKYTCNTPTTIYNYLVLSHNQFIEHQKDNRLRGALPIKPDDRVLLEEAKMNLMIVERNERIKNNSTQLVKIYYYVNTLLDLFIYDSTAVDDIFQHIEGIIKFNKYKRIYKRYKRDTTEKIEI